MFGLSLPFPLRLRLRKRLGEAVKLDDSRPECDGVSFLDPPPRTLPPNLAAVLSTVRLMTPFDVLGDLVGD